jgi:hypothetical protein
MKPHILKPRIEALKKSYFNIHIEIENIFLSEKYSLKKLHTLVKRQRNTCIKLDNLLITNFRKKKRAYKKLEISVKRGVVNVPI